MNMRKITSMTALLSFVLLIATSIILYIVPAGRVAYWANWRLWGLSKEQWGAVHINLGFLLLLTMVLHVYYNWQSLVSYMKNKTKKFKLFTVDFNVSLLITLVVFFGTLAGLPPMSTIIDLGAKISENANLHYGEPPYGHAEMSSLADFSYKVKVDLAEGITRLQAAGYEVPDSKQTISQLAEANGVSPKLLYAVIKPQAAEPSATMPEDPPGGTGQRRLADLCRMYQLDVDKIVAGLAQQGINATPEQTMKEIASAQGKDPHTLYAVIYQLSLQ